MRRCLAGPMLAAAPPYCSLARVRTSAITSRSPARATTSSSPTRRRKFRVTMVKPCDSRKAQALFSARDPVSRRSMPGSPRRQASGRGGGGGGGVQRCRSTALDAYPFEPAAYAPLRVHAQRAGEALRRDVLAALERGRDAQRVVAEGEQP